MRPDLNGRRRSSETIEDLGKSYPDNTAIIFWKSFIEAETGQFEAALTDMRNSLEFFRTIL